MMDTVKLRRLLPWVDRLASVALGVAYVTALCLFARRIQRWIFEHREEPEVAAIRRYYHERFPTIYARAFAAPPTILYMVETSPALPPAMRRAAMMIGKPTLGHILATARSSAGLTVANAQLHARATVTATGVTVALSDPIADAIEFETQFGLLRRLMSMLPQERQAEYLVDIKAALARGSRTSSDVRRIRIALAGGLLGYVVRSRLGMSDSLDPFGSLVRLAAGIGMALLVATAFLLRNGFVAMSRLADFVTVYLSVTGLSQVDVNLLIGVVSAALAAGTVIAIAVRIKLRDD